MKFTQQVKDLWVGALKSKKYFEHKGTGRLRDKDGKYCCLGVLIDALPDLHIDKQGIQIASKESESGLSYYGNSNDKTTRKNTPLGLSNEEVCELVNYNDDMHKYDGDFSNMIPIIEKLPVDPE